MLDRVRECLRLLSYELLVNFTSGEVCLLLQDADSWATSSSSAQMAGHMLGPQLAHGNVTGMVSISNTMKKKCRTCRCAFYFCWCSAFHCLCFSVSLQRTQHCTADTQNRYNITEFKSFSITYCDETRFKLTYFKSFGMGNRITLLLRLKTLLI